MIKVIDNFLPSYQFKEILSIIQGPGFRWYYNDGILFIPQPKVYQFKHTFYKDEWETGKGNPSDYYWLWDYTQRLLGVETLFRIKANLRPGTTFPSGGGFHTDYVNMTTAIFYINTNNGGTKFKNGRKVKSVANRMLIFDSNLMHQSVSCTDKKRRIVINFNFKTNLNNQK